MTVDAVVVGAGLRGMLSYGMRAEEAGVRFVAVVEPIASRRAAFAAAHGLAPDRCFASVDDWLAAPGAPFAPAALVATPDREHVAPTLAALAAGCHVLLEKPMAPSLAECRQLVAAADAAGRQLHVCHVMRYSPVFRTIHEVVASGRLGRIVSIDHRENVDARHMAHSYVRGAYRREDGSNPMLLAKSCHDLDLLAWLLGDDEVVRVASFGSLAHFRAESVGPEIPARCTDGCPIEPECTFSAIRAYAPEHPVDHPEIALLTQLFPLSDPATFDRASRLDALRTSPYGRCAYRCDNDVVDHQVVAMETRSGATIAFTMQGHSHQEGRTLRIDGTLATLRAAITEVDPEVSIHRHGSDEHEVLDLGEHGRSDLGHSGGDLGVLRAFAASLAGAGEGLSTDARTSLESHLLGWAAEEARRRGTVVEVASLR
ncbi:MAG: Gfo/Idh/MocA family oxidoreductase [Acidimicrobiales bacterium]|nr:Gfo/Idh/MocA family oxidoreductase [Acidimicrobiales bacterium]HRW38151.1 Gfo/Idh/MocA family oxidoreductase [Aquihabitans sp.]